MHKVFALALLASVSWQPLAYAQGFDVNDGGQGVVRPPAPSSLRLPTPSRDLPSFSAQQPVSSVARDYNQRGLPPLSPVAAPGAAPSAITPPPIPSEALPPTEALAMPAKPLYPARIGSLPETAPVAPPVAAPVVTAAPAFPPPPAGLQPIAPPVVEAAVAAPIPQGTIATLPPPPAPLQAPAPVAMSPAVPPVRPPAPASIAVGAPPTVLGQTAIPVAPPVAAAPLSPESKQILSGITPPKAAPAPRPAKLDVKRVNPEVANIVKNAEQHYESAGVSIRVRQPGLDPVSELERAYNALMGGESEVAVRIYKDILQSEPTNEDALFGLAATYHRTGQLDNARPLYGRLLKQNPGHKEALNNFLMLVSTEAPEAALNELSTLEQRYPSFSPIPAQMAILFEKLGQPEIARSKLLRAIELSPENWVYKYNLAIMLDRQKQYAAAAEIYRELIKASLQGEPLPMDMHALQARYNYISAKSS